MWRKARAERKTRKTRKQSGGYVPYRANPVGGVYADVLDWDDSKEKTA